MFHSGNYFLHTGHVLLSFNHGLIQSGWKRCPHGKNKDLFPFSKSVMQTEQVGCSILPSSVFLQCWSFIVTNGIFAIVSSLVGFLGPSYY